MRIEHDLLGEREVPDEVYWGVHTLRAAENFAITGEHVAPELIVALACVKQAAAEANRELGVLDARRADAIVESCEEVRAGQLHDQFVVDAIQGGAGTSTNMNANEVIANRALELLGHARGDYGVVHPNEHVNACQSTNDVYPTAVKLALIILISELRHSLGELSDAFARRADAHADVIKIGRTQLQDAVPMTLGHELRAFAVMIGEDVARLGEAAALLHEINLGGTAIGTGITAPPGYRDLVRERLSAITGLPLRTAFDLVEATQDAGVFVQVSGVLKRVAVKLSKMCNDLRLLATLGELALPPVQAGSSIMPGKVNPVIPEVVNQVAFEVVGNDATVTFAAEAGQLQLNAFEPVIFRALHASLAHLRAATDTLRERCVEGLTANRELIERRTRESPAVVTALNPYIGYEAATAVALEAAQTGRGIAELVVARGLLPAGRADDIIRTALRPAG